jgi:predicted nucleotidyltransferase
MKTAAVIAEFNPFHNGHAYLARMARSLTGADFVIAVMSGDFVQRGEPAVLDKYTRTRMALLGGFDMVIELPVFGSCASAEHFAASAVSILDRMGCADYLCFGCETDDPALLERTADVLASEPEDYRKVLRSETAQGSSFPAARAQAVRAVLGPEAAEMLHHPNNILAAEYLKALRRRNSTIKAVPVRRTGSHHDSLTPDGHYMSAAAIRALLIGGSGAARQKLPSFIPPASYQVLENAMQSTACLQLSDFSALTAAQLLLQRGRLEDYCDISPEIANRIRNLLPQFTDAQSFLDLLKTKNYTRARLARCLLSVLLGRTKETQQRWKASGYLCTPQVLGFSREAGVLFGRMAPDFTYTASPLAADGKPADQMNPLSVRLFRQTILASELYRQTAQQKSGRVQPEILRRGIITI